MWGDEDIQPLLDEAQEKLAEGDYNGAYELFQTACNRNPDAAEAHYGLGLVWTKREDYHRARQCLGRAVTLDPGMRKAHDLMAQCDQFLHPTQKPAAPSAMPEDDMFGLDDTTSSSSSSYRPAQKKGGGGGGPLVALAWTGIIIFGVILVALGGWFAFDNFVGGSDIRPTDQQGRPQVLVPAGSDDKGKMTFKTAPPVDESRSPSVQRQAQTSQPPPETGTSGTRELSSTSETTIDDPWGDLPSPEDIKSMTDAM